MEYSLIDKKDRFDFFDGAYWHTIDKKTFSGYAIGFDSYTKALSNFLGFKISEPIEDLEIMMSEYFKEEED